MRCYGDKKKSFTDKVPSGMLPVVRLRGAIPLTLVRPVRARF